MRNYVYDSLITHQCMHMFHIYFTVTNSDKSGRCAYLIAAHGHHHWKRQSTNHSVLSVLVCMIVRLLLFRRDQSRLYEKYTEPLLFIDICIHIILHTRINVVAYRIYHTQLQCCKTPIPFNNYYYYFTQIYTHTLYW